MGDNEYYGSGYDDIGSKIRYLEEKQRFSKDRIMLIGKNLIDIREKTNEDVMELKKELQKTKQELAHIKSFLEVISKSLSKFAKKEDLEILTKQAKIFQPLEFVKKSEIGDLLK